ncbi:glutathione S-transferase [Variovorax sp. J22R133]|uniref:glutathione S-transferase family protein n=1 Tax=Variovorax brevis TaxID=3053503 RepID=UPI002576139B|nr:glutathione S-transferase [Variovorax sp. J22R133]MDM0117109.1 glutathione S-transferase [Variovorax sp. J22R133]
MLNIWGRISSINVRKVVWCAQELGLDFQRTEAGGKFGVVQTAQYRTLNPNALVPAIDDGEGAERVTLWESNVIVRYLCAKHSPGTFYPTDLASRFDAERWMDWQQTTLNPAGRGAFVQFIRTPAAERNPAVIAQSTGAAEQLFAMLDAHLATHEYMAGDHFTMAEIPVGCEVHRWFGLPVTEYTRPSWPNLERWFGQLRNRTGSRGVLDLALE